MPPRPGAIGERFKLELQDVGHGQRERLGWRKQAPYLVHHNRRGNDIAVQHQLAGHLQRFQTDLARHQQQLDEGAVPFGLLEDVIAHKLNGDRQLPFAERYAIAQRAGLDLRIPMHRGHLLRFDRGRATDLMAAPIPI
jgi:hypothetical protein